MTQISKSPISKKVENKIFDLFVKTLIAIKEEDQAKLFMEDIFTPIERLMLAKRIGIAFLLEKGYNYQTIRSILHVSAPTIASVSRNRQFGNNSYQQFLSEINRDEALKSFFDDILLKVVSLSAKSSKGASGWKYLEKRLRKAK